MSFFQTVLSMNNNSTEIKPIINKEINKNKEQNNIHYFGNGFIMDNIKSFYKPKFSFMKIMISTKYQPFMFAK